MSESISACSTEKRDTKIDSTCRLSETRHTEIQEISQKIQCIHDIYKDLGTLVTEQGNDINVIETHTLDTRNRTERGLIELQEAKRYRSRCVIM